MTRIKILIASIIIALFFSLDTFARTSEILQNTFEEHKGQIFTLYHSALQTQPGFGGKINFKISLNETGDVTACKGDGENEQLSSLAVKICEVIGTMNFGGGEEFHFDYMINFFES